MNRQTLVMNVDYFDELALHDHPMGPREVEALIRQCAESGVDTIFWRAIGLGTAGYPSRYVASARWAAEADFDLSIARMPPAERETHGRRGVEPWGGKLTASLAQMDPIAEARDACRRHGLRFLIWLDFLDERQNRFLTEHPECLVLGRDGKTPWPGLRSYACEAAVANQLQVVDELMVYRPDGLYVSTSCHTRHLVFPEPDDFFGWEPSVAAAYRRGVGRGICDGQVDVDAWHAVKGDFVTEFFRLIKQRLAPTGAKLAIGTQFGPHTILTSPVFSTHVPYRFFTQWRRWVDEGLADILVLGDYEWPWDFHPVWEAKGIACAQGRYPADTLTREYVEYAAGRSECWLFSSWLSAYAQRHQGASAGSLADAMRMRSATIHEQGADGICLHEAHTFERYGGFETVAEMRQTLSA